MPYEYRKLTTEEREAVLRQRLESGYPWHAPPHPYTEGGFYLITAANYEHAHIMADPARRTDFEGRLLNSLKASHLNVSGWVILPNHYHVLVGVDSLEQLPGIVQHLHGSTSREWNLADGQTGKRKVWYNFSDRAIRDERHFYKALNYMHYNPVKHGYVTDPYEWPWVSLGTYVENHGRAWLRQQWKAYPPEEFGRGWDD